VRGFPTGGRVRAWAAASNHTLWKCAAVAWSLTPRYRALVVLAAGTGLRQGESFGVVDDRLDLTARTFRVDRS
jgi:hypothetical protein